MKSSLDDCENPNLLTKTERVVESDKGLLPDQIGWNTLFKPPASTTQFECERSALLAKATASSSRFKNRRRIVEPIQKSVFPSEPIETRKNSAWDFDEFEDSNTPMDDEVSVSLVAQDLLPSDTVSSGKNFNGIKNVRFSPICDSIPAPKSVAVPIEVESEEQTTPIVFGRCAESDLCRHMMKVLPYFFGFYPAHHINPVNRCFQRSAILVKEQLRKKWKMVCRMGLLRYELSCLN